ncbi:hypothetical protein [Pseudomonas sp. Leaf58]|uniref:hypothetical protein n=1 Tax=unclassified Pseudomonas TaxID=196821 RepID=UPI0012E7F02B|nr:hypothetical protein [Pseudomonas sp. Leaf58]
MKTFIDRNPKEKAVEESFAVLARNSYVHQTEDPADKAFVIADRLKRQSRRKKLHAESTPSI